MAATRVYVSNAETKDICVFDMHPKTGALTGIERVAVPGTDVPSPTSLSMAVSPTRRCLHTALRSPPLPVSSYGIDPSTGRLTHLGATPLVAAIAYLVTDRSGRFLLCASYTEARIAVYPIEPTGRIGANPTQILSTGPHAHCIVVDSTNRFAYSAILGADHVMQLVFDAAAGALAPNTSPAVATRKNAGPRHLAFHPSGRFLYLLNQTDATVRAYRIEPGTGTLAEIETLAARPVNFPTEASAADIHPTPDGALSTSANVKAALSPDSASTRTPACCADRALAHGNHFAIDSRGRFLLAAGLDSDHLGVHAIDQQDGSLAPRARYQVGAMPNLVEVLDVG